MSEDLLNTYLTEDPNLLPSIRNLKAVCVRVCVCVCVCTCVCVQLRHQRIFVAGS